MYEISVNETPVKIWASAVDPHAWKEIMNLASLPFVFHHLAFMPDLHGGKGMPIGGGNHFIELQRDTDDNLWIMIHSGSRNLGNKVAEYYDRLAAQENARNFSVVGPEFNLAFIYRKTPLFGAYWEEMKYCVDFAFCNRSLMMQRIQEVLADALPGIAFEPMINIAHNYAAIENHFGENVFVHRKGAVRARADEVMANQQDLVRILTELSPVAVIKGV
jgi:RNA-splicing ligase RtcB